MIRKLIIDHSFGCVRAAVVEDGLLSEIHLEKQSADDQAESIFLGRIQAIKPSLHAAFVDIGSETHAFLPIREEMKLRCGDMLVVQGQAKQSTETKGLRITDNVNIAGKWLVLLPHGRDVHISKKIKDPALRNQLHQLASEICPADCGLIVRTAGEDVTEELLIEEVRNLYHLWQEILLKAKGMTKPGLLHQRQPLHMRLARDLSDISEIHMNQAADFQMLLDAQAREMIPESTKIILNNEERQLIFDTFNIETQIEKALKKRVWLPCGGYLIIDPCEAMTVIDVNSGKMILGRDLEETALRVNREAAKEVARQLRLRNIGGIVMVDFIDMRKSDHQQEIIRVMKEETISDRAQVNVEGFTRLGLMEITRKRKHEQLRKAVRCSCSYCSGQGEVLSGEEVALRAMHQLRRMVISGQRGPFVIRCSASAAQALSALIVPEGIEVYACAASGRHAEKYDIEQIGMGMPLPSGDQMLK